MALKRFFSRRFFRVETYFGFPCEGAFGAFGAKGAKEGRRADRGRRGQRGVAMILAIMVISMMFIFMADMLVNSAVSLQLARVHRNNIKAEYLAKSGKNLALFLLSLDFGIDLTTYKTTKKIPSDGPGDVWGMMNGLPVGQSMVEMMAAGSGVKLSKVNDGDTIETLEAFDGTFTIDISDEMSKLNVNFCAIGRGGQCLRMLNALMSCPAEKEFLDRKKLVAEEVAANIKDWVDSGSSVAPGSKHSSEEDPYEDREPEVDPKNAPFDSLLELKLVDGWDDEMHQVFSPYLTIHPVQIAKEEVPKININSIAAPLMACLIRDKGDDCRQKSILSMMPAGEEDALEDVSGHDGVKGRLRDIFCEQNKKVVEQFTYRSDIYRVVITGEVDEQKRKMEMVLRRMLPDARDKKNGFAGSYKILEWKML